MPNATTVDVLFFYCICKGECEKFLLYGNIDQTLVNSLHRLNCEIGGLDCRGITTENRTHVHSIHKYDLICNALVYVIYSVVSGQYLCQIAIRIL